MRATGPPPEEWLLEKPPPLDEEWVKWDSENPRPKFKTPEEKRSWYTGNCRRVTREIMADGAPDFHLSQGIDVKRFTVPASDGYAIPVYGLHSGDSREPEVVVICYHGGGLWIGEGDSEELSYRRFIKASSRTMAVYAPEYRLMPDVTAKVCLSDSINAFDELQKRHPKARCVLLGSSSGGQLAALVSHQARAGSIDAVVLRCPVTSDAPNGTEYIPERFRRYYTTDVPEFATSALKDGIKCSLPYDGLDYMPLEAPPGRLSRLLRH